MCLKFAVEDPERILNKGVHVGHEWVVTHNWAGTRCGYVKVEAGHPWHGKSYDEVEPDVHGGITFAEPDVPCDKGGEDTGWWLGFDFAHLGDVPDNSLPRRGPEFDLAGEFGALLTTLCDVPIKDRSGTWTQEQVEAECRKLCEQAAAVA